MPHDASATEEAGGGWLTSTETMGDGAEKLNGGGGWGAYIGMHPRATEGEVGHGSAHGAYWTPARRPLGARVVGEASAGWPSAMRSAGDTCSRVTSLAVGTLFLGGSGHTVVVANGMVRWRLGWLVAAPHGRHERLAQPRKAHVARWHKEGVVGS
jgi:hypothetical protein